ncbi:hypothetical protein CY35_05G050800 [Sphagnum magellanicum]|nr:hypothetical protein CY35_05G050800 [Sphagnum magellanicum]
MGSTNPSKRHAEKKIETELGSIDLAKKPSRQWKLLDFISLTMMAGIVILFLLIFTSLGDSLAASGQLYLDHEESAAAQLQLAGAKTSSSVKSDFTGSTVSSSFWEQVENGQLVEFCSDRYVDHMPCHDPKRAVKLSRERNFYKERHCPPAAEKLNCLIPSPPQYQRPIPWPESLRKIWYGNIPHTEVVQSKSSRHWVKKEGQYFVFPVDETNFPDGVGTYVQQLAQYIPFDTGAVRTALDIGCGDASFGAYLLSKDVLTMSFAPRDSRKPQVQFALERGIPAFVGAMGTLRLPFPSFSYDLVHCSRCLLYFTANNGSYFMEVDRLLRGGGFFVFSVALELQPFQKTCLEELQELVTQRLCYTQVEVGDSTVIWQKPMNSSCHSHQHEQPAICPKENDADKAWYVPLDYCITRPTAFDDLGEGMNPILPKWPERLEKVPLRLIMSNHESEQFKSDIHTWKSILDYYKKTLHLKIGSPEFRNIMDMNSGYGGFAANLVSEPVWVMNVVPAFGVPNTLHAIFDRGLIGVLHDWCEPFSTYPRTYDLIHVSNLMQSTAQRCSLAEVGLEMDRILRPGGMVVVRDTEEMIHRISKIATALHWTFEVANMEPEGVYHLVARKHFRKQKSYLQIVEFQKFKRGASKLVS